MRKRFTLLFSVLFLSGILSTSALFAQPLSGAYTIDPAGSGSTNYTTVAAAASALSSYGVSGPVTFAVSANTFTGRVTLNAISGASATNTISFTGKGAGKTILQYAGTGTSSRAVIAFNGADYVKFEEMTIENTSTSNAMAVHMANSSDYNTFKNCNLFIPNFTNSNGICFMASSSEGSVGSGNSANFLTIEGCNLKGGYYGLVLYGYSSSSRCKNNQLLKSTITNVYYYGIYTYNQEYYLIENNTISDFTYSNAYAYYGYYCYNSNFNKNIISGAYYGVYPYYHYDCIFNGNNVSGGSYAFYPQYTYTSTFENNYAQASSYPFYIYYCQYVNLIGNTVNGGSYGIYLYYGRATVVDKNYITGSSYGIRPYYENRNYTSDKTYITNNMITNCTYSGIYYCYYAYNLQILHNTILNPATSSSYSYSGVYLYYSYNAVVKNNIISAPVPAGGFCIAVYYGSNNEIDYNDYYYPNSGGNNKFFIAGTYYTNLSGFKGNNSAYTKNPHDQNSWDNVDPKFESATDLHIYPTASTIMEAPIILPSTNYFDYDKDVRPTTNGNHHIGCDHVLTIDLDLVSLSPTVAMMGNNSVKVSAKNKGINPITPQTLTFQYQVDGGSWVSQNYSLGTSLAPGKTIDVTFTTPWFISSDKTYTLKARIYPQLSGDPDPSDSLINEVMLGMAGTYVIDPLGTGHYLSFTEAVNDLKKRGVGGAVTFDVYPGTYTERVNLPQITGASATNDISFIGHGRTSTILTSTGSSTGDWTTLRLNGADYTRFKDMTIQNLGASYGNAVFFTNSADYNVIDNCDLKVSIGTNSYLVPLIFSGSLTSYSGSGNNGNYNKITNNTLTGGYFSVTLYGIGSSSLIWGNEFINNTFTSFYYYGFYSYYNGGTKIENNRFVNQTHTTAGYTIYHYYCSQSSIQGNYMEPVYYGIYHAYNNYYFQQNSSVIASNVITNFKYATYQIGIYSYYNYNTTIANNSIWVDGSYNTSYSYSAIYVYYPYSVTVKNNILTTSSGTLLLSVYNPGTSYYVYIDNNIYNYPTTATQYRFYSYYNGYFYNLTDFKKDVYYLGQHDVNSKENVDPMIISKSNHHLRQGFMGFPGAFMPQATIDIDGEPRCALMSIIGPDEPPRKKGDVGFIAYDTMCHITPVTFQNIGLKTEPYAANWHVNGSYVSNSFNLTHSFKNTGYDTVTLYYQTCFTTDTITKYVYINPASLPPVSEFITNTNIVETGDKVQLTDISDNCPSTWAWNILPATVYDPLTMNNEPSHEYVDGTTSSSSSPVVVFKYPGDYTVELTSSNSIGTSPKESKARYINVKLSELMCGASIESANQFGNLYDDGGPTGVYSKNKFCTYLIKPCTEKVKITFFEFNLGDSAYLRLYDGGSNRGIPIWNTAKYPKGITGVMSAEDFDTFLYATQSGMVFVEFSSKTETVNTGFKLEWAGSGAGNFLPPVASFDNADTGCIVSAFYLENTSVTDHRFTRYIWDYDGNGTIDGTDINGEFHTSFPGLAAEYLTRLVVENCGGKDTAEKKIVLVNPQVAPTGTFVANIETPVVSQDIVTLNCEPDEGSCINTYEWTITPSDYYFTNNTNQFSEFPQIIFTKIDSFDVKLIMGNSNTPFKSSAMKQKYIVPKEYCSPLVLNLHADIGISRVKLEAIDNSSAIGQTGYTNYTNIGSAKLVVDQSFNITVERITNYNAMTRYIWIDYNQNGVFDHPGELAAKEDSATTMTWTGTITVPNNARLGATRMRVGGVYSASQNTPCSPVKFGEYEDYRVFISPDNIPPVITLIDNDTMYLELGYTFNDPGATAFDNIEGNISNRIVTSNYINNKIVGAYYVAYEACDNLDNCTVVRRLVYVTPDNTPPVITLTGGDPLYVNVNEPFNDKSYSAYDIADGDITANVVLTHNIDPYRLGNYSISYKVTDKQGLSDTKSRSVVVADVAAPEINLLGDPVVYVEIMTPFVDPGVSYADNYWPKERISFTKTGLVDTTKIGTYTLTYAVTDASGNGPNSVSRTIIVWDSTAPSIELAGPDEVIVEVNSTWEDPGLIITDNSYTGYVFKITGTLYKQFPPVEGKITPTVVGTYSIFYQIEDAAGNISTMVARIVRVVDTKCPEIQLLGDEFLSIEKWTNYVDDGYAVTDNYYPIAKIKVDTFNDVNVYEPGIYKVTYTASDPSNKECHTVVRLVKVVYNNVGVDDNNATRMAVYPNPTTGKVLIMLDLPQGEQAVISVLNLLGEQLMLVNNSDRSDNKYEVDLSDFAAGVYVVKVQTNHEALLERVILTK